MTAFTFPAKADAKTVTELRSAHNHSHDFWRAVPEAQWNLFAKPGLDWWSRTIGFARGLVTTGSFTWDAQWTPGELDTLWELAVSGRPGITVHYNTHQTAALNAWVARATTAELARALDASCEPGSVTTLFPAFSAAQVAAIKPTRIGADAASTDYYQKAAAATRRWSFVIHTSLSEAEFAALASVNPEDLFPGNILDPESVAKVRPHLAAVRPALRAWVTRALEWEHAFTYDAHAKTETIFVLWAAALEGAQDPLVAQAAAMIAAQKTAFRKERNREKLAERYGGALVAASDPSGVLAALRAATKDKSTIDMLDRARKVLDTNLGRAGTAPVSWGAMDPVAGEALLAASSNAKQAIADALCSADGNVALRVFLSTSLLLRGSKPDMLGGDEWKTLRSILATLDRTAGDSLPDKIVRPTWGKMTLDEAFAWAWEVAVYALTRTAYSSKPTTEDKLRADVQKLHDASENERFRGLLKGVLGESQGAKLVRLAAACDLAKGTITRYFVERTDEEPGKQDVNRLYGAPLGVSAKAWPRTKKKQPMHHLITLESRALSPEVRRDLDRAAAIAVFASDLDDPTGGFALVSLSRADLAKAHEPVVAPVIAGVKLALLEIVMPKAAFLGGKKTGPLKELRIALDSLDVVLSTDTVSPRWIQEPEPDGTLIVELRESFASKLNFGDAGAIYVMTGGVVFQCH